MVNRRTFFATIAAALAIRKLPKLVAPVATLSLTGIQGWLPKIYVDRFCPNDRIYCITVDKEDNWICGPKHSLATYARPYTVPMHNFNA